MLTGYCSENDFVIVTEPEYVAGPGQNKMAGKIVEFGPKRKIVRIQFEHPNRGLVSEWINMKNVHPPTTDTECKMCSDFILTVSKERNNDE